MERQRSDSVVGCNHLGGMTLPIARFHLWCLQFIGVIGLFLAPAFGAEAQDDSSFVEARAQMMSTYKAKVSPFITTYCGRCHTGLRQRGGVTFSSALKD